MLVYFENVDVRMQNSEKIFHVFASDEGQIGFYDARTNRIFDQPSLPPPVAYDLII
jgi:hypothetical protein